MLPVQPLGNLEENYYITGSCEAHWPKGTFKRAALHTFNMLYKLFAAFLIIGPSRAFSARRLDVGSRFSSKPSSLDSDTLQNNGSQNDGNKTQFVWILQDLYAGNTFFDRWSFFNQGDPSHGSVNFLNKTAAFANGLAYVTNDNVVIMKGDDTTWLAAGEFRMSAYQAWLNIMPVFSFVTSIVRRGAAVFGQHIGPPDLIGPMAAGSIF
jgi:hypothetical protein